MPWLHQNEILCGHLDRAEGLSEKTKFTRILGKLF
jgi:hypothetical protein